MVDESKCVKALGTKTPVPVEVIPFGWKLCQRELETLGCRAELRRREGRPFVTDNGHFILDCWFGPISDPHRLAENLKAVVGVVEHGLFLGLAHGVIVGTRDGVVIHTSPATQKFPAGEAVAERSPR